ncbi:MAG: late control protein D [Hyphomicrobiales bacterium]|nr:late control protein D [Hyphomicrobiales bacterium]
MIDGQKPIARLIYQGKDIWGAIEADVISLTFTDNLEAKADEIQLELKNESGKWLDAWFPELNDKLQGFLGYRGGKMLDMGTFFLDQPNAHGSRQGDLFTLRGQSKPVDKSLKTKKTTPYENQSHKQVAQKVLSDAGLNMIGEPPQLSFARITQRREFDLEFLARMASDYGCFFAIKGGNAIYANRDDLIAQSPVRQIVKGSRDIMTYSLKHEADKTYSKAKASYFDGNAKKNIEVEVEDKEIKTGDKLRVDDRVESEGHARKLAASKLQKSNMNAWTGSFELVGDPSCQAGQTVSLSGFGRWDRKYIIKSARHHLARGGYSTAIEVADARKSAA